MTLQRWGIERYCMVQDEKGEWVRASEAETEIAAWKQLSAQHEIEIARLRKALEGASDFANSHSLPCLSEIVDPILEGK